MHEITAGAEMSVEEIAWHNTEVGGRIMFLHRQVLALVAGCAPDDIDTQEEIDYLRKRILELSKDQWCSRTIH